ncbi:hypothetical protein PAXRUDRAFT_795377 [Paxillus rubicundulus Ve08.2h10]|uniref:Uncharacterized protein n=1 Tax=Paxillus rubicundulus Ve08.2h10 TaxID=930991 RepID=A0A0D0DTM7_9AGAM|nr:hypothetical protein PAXRUDRAFT_795377 [Paxillus rubicundulus Ve08.2h10]
MTMLAKYGKGTYKVTEEKPYSFKYLLPPAKVCGDAMDVDSAMDFANMEKSLSGLSQTKSRFLLT